MTCPHCNEPLGGLARFCSACGKYTDDTKPQTPTTAPSLSEDEIQRLIVDYLHAVGCDVVDTSQPRATMITEGLSDLIVFGDGKMVFAEIKRPGRKQSKNQERFEKWCQRAGVNYEIWSSVDGAQKWFGRSEEKDVA